MRYILLACSTGGLLFSGYLSSVKFFSGYCALAQPCPYFLGYPACYYGFVMFVVVTALAWIYARRLLDDAVVLKWIVWLSGIGVLFAGYFVYNELPVIMSAIKALSIKDMPSCVYGFIFYVLIFVVGMREMYTNKPMQG